MANQYLYVATQSLSLTLNDEAFIHNLGHKGREKSKETGELLGADGRVHAHANDVEALRLLLAKR